MIRNDRGRIGWPGVGGWAALASISVLLLYALCRYAVPGPFDEGFALYNSWRVFLGDVPGRDLWQIYGPGTPFLNAAVFWVAGVNLLTFRIADLVVKICLLIAVALVARRAGARFWAAWSFVLSSLVLAGLAIFGYSLVPALAFTLFSQLAWVRAADKGSIRWALVTGALVALAGLFRPDFGVYAFGAIGVAVACQATLLRETIPLKMFAWMVAAAFAASLLAYAWPLSQAGVGVLWEQLIRFPLLGDLKAYTLDSPGFFRPFHAIKWWVQTSDRRNLEPLKLWTAWYPAMMAYVLGTVVALRRLHKGREFLSSSLLLLLLSVIGTALLNHAARRMDMFHLFPSVLISTAVIAVLMGQGLFKPWLLVIAMFITLVQGGLGLYDWSQALQAPAKCYAGNIPEAGGLRLPADLGEAVEAVRSTGDQRQPILIVNANQDRPLVNHLLFLFLAQRRSAIFHFIIYPGLWSVQLPEIQKVLAEKKAVCVIWSGWVRERGTSELDKAIWSYGASSKTIGDFEIKFPNRGGYQAESR